MRNPKPLEQLLDFVVAALQPDIGGLQLRALNFALQIGGLQEAVVADDDHLGLGAEESHHVGRARLAVDGYSGVEVKGFLDNDAVVVLVDNQVDGGLVFHILYSCVGVVLEHIHAHQEQHFVVCGQMEVKLLMLVSGLEGEGRGCSLVVVFVHNFSNLLMLLFLNFVGPRQLGLLRIHHLCAWLWQQLVCS